MHRKLALLLGITIMSSVVTKSPEAYAAEFSKVNSKIITKQEKLIGTTRYETAIKVSKQGWASGANNVVLVSDIAIADALSATPFADAINAPILLTQKNSLNKETKAQLKALATKKVYIVGGEGVVSKSVEEELKKDGITVDRIYGANRESTALEVAKRLNKIKPITEVAVVNGYIGLADAVSIAAVAANKDMPIILSSVDTLSSETDKFIKSSNINNSYIIGGQGVVSKGLESKLPNAKRISGQTRKETNAKVIETFYKNNELDNIYVSKDGVVSENQLIDALAVGALAAKNNSPILLVSNNLNNTQEDIINTKSFKTVTQVGGAGNETAFNQLSDIQSEKVYNVSTIAELNKAIADSNANDTINVNFDKMAKTNESITINTNKKISLTLKGTYNNTIIITSENLALSNEGKIKSIVVQGENSYNSINFINNGTIENLTIKNGSKVNVKNSGEIKILTNNSSQTVISGSGSINKPENPSNPEVPAEPEVPSNPEVPVDPEEPSEPDAPVNPETPNEPGTSEEPDASVKPEIPNEPEDSEKPNNPGTSEDPQKPIEPDAPVKPETPNEPESPENSDDETKPSEPNKSIEEINKLIEKIDSSITLEDENSLDEIEKSLVEIEKRYSLLNEDEKKSIVNYEKVEKAKEDVETVREQLYAVFRAIFEIPEEITLDNLVEADAAVIKAEKAYEVLKPEHRNGVMSTEVSIITRSRQEIERLREGINPKSINESIEKIDSSITLEDENSLDEIEKSLVEIEKRYSLLSEEEKKSIDNYEKVEKAKEDVETVREQLYAVFRAIFEIPEEITLDNLVEADAAVIKAEKAYEALKPEHRNGVMSTELSIITRSRQEIERLREGINPKSINESIEKIDSSITLEDENSLDKIEKNLVEIEKRYSLLSEEEKKSIDNYEKVEKAKEDVETVREQLYAVFRAIFEIPEEITLDNLVEADAAVIKAEKAYEALKPEHRKGVMSTELSIITRSRNKINYLKRNM